MTEERGSPSARGASAPSRDRSDPAAGRPPAARPLVVPLALAKIHALATTAHGAVVSFVGRTLRVREPLRVLP